MATVAGKPTRSRHSQELTRSGRLLLRMPRALHEALAARADKAGLSLNQHIVETLTAALEDKRAPARAAIEREMPRSVRLALIANAIVVALAAATCVVLLLWR